MVVLLASAKVAAKVAWLETTVVVVLAFLTVEL